MKVLVTVASKHGATGEIGEIIAGVLRDAAMEVDTHAPQDVADLEGYDAVVLGSAVYAGRWLEPARAFVDRHATALLTRPIWLFSSGALGDPPKPEGELPEALALVSKLGAREHRSFPGRLDRSRLGFMERTITKALKAPDGDFRDLDSNPHRTLTGRASAAFDTSVNWPRWLSGSAAEGIRQRLERVGAKRPTVATESFIVSMEPEMPPGELERARSWGASLIAGVTPPLVTTSAGH